MSEPRREERAQQAALGSGGHAAQARSGLAAARVQRAAAAARRRRRRVRRDRRGARRRPAARAPPGGRRARRGRRRRSDYAPRFQFMTGALVAVGIAALVGITVAIVGIPPKQRAARPGRRGSRPRGGLQGATEIAEPHRRRLPRPGQAAGQGRRQRHLLQGHPAARRAAQVRRGGRRDPGPRREGRPLPDVRPGGELPDRRAASPPRSAASCCAARGSSWRSTASATSGTSSRSSCSSRRRPGKAQTIALYFSRDELRPELDRPLTSSLLPDGADDQDRHPLARRAAGRPDDQPVPLLAHGLELQRPRLPRARPVQPGRRSRAAEAPEGAAEAGRGRRGAGRRRLDASGLGRLSSAARDKLARAKARLDTLDLYPRPVRMRRVRLVSAPWLFRLPWFRRFDGYTMWDLILVRAPVADAERRPRDPRALPRLADAAPPAGHAAVLPVPRLPRQPQRGAGAAGGRAHRAARSASACATPAASSASCGRAAARSSPSASARGSTAPVPASTRACR